MSAPDHNPLLSIPALAAAVRRVHDSAPHSGNLPASYPRRSDVGKSRAAARRAASVEMAPELYQLQPARLVPMYRISPVSPEPAAEAAAAAHVIMTLSDRLRRLTAAYGEWTDFDPAAYFDLTVPQTACLLHLTERVTSVHLAFFTDLLLPSFQNTVLYFENHFLPHYRHMQAALQNGSGMAPAAAHGGIFNAGMTDGGAAGIGVTADVTAAQAAQAEVAQRFFDEIQPTLTAHWLRALTVARHTRRLLNDDPGFWALNAANDERLRRRWAWRMRPAPGIAAALLPKLTDVPTLTLAIDFPQPAARQSGRLRRLRRGRAHRAHAARPHLRRDRE